MISFIAVPLRLLLVLEVLFSGLGFRTGLAIWHSSEDMSEWLPAMQGGMVSCTDAAKENMYVFGGETASDGVSDKLYQIPVASDGDNPTDMNGLFSGEKPSPRKDASMVKIGDDCMLFGVGGVGSSPDPKVWKFNPDAISKRWKQVTIASSTVPLSRHSHATAVVEGQYMFVYGGIASDTGETLNELWRLNLTNEDREGAEWTLMYSDPDTTFGPEQGRNHAVLIPVQGGHNLVLAFGEDSSGTFCSSSWFYQVRYKRWELLHLFPSPSPRVDATVVVDNIASIALLFGGEGPDGLLRDLWLLNSSSPSSSEWRWHNIPSSSQDLPLGMTNATAEFISVSSSSAIMTVFGGPTTSSIASSTLLKYNLYSCPNDCQGRSECIFGACRACTKPYTGIDCGDFRPPNCTVDDIIVSNKASCIGSSSFKHTVRFAWRQACAETALVSLPDPQPIECLGVPSSNMAVMLFTVFVILGLVLVVAFAVFGVAKREHPLLRQTQAPFMNVILLGCASTSVSTLLNITPAMGRTHCQAQIPMATISFYMVFGPLTIRAYRFYRIRKHCMCLVSENQFFKWFFAGLAFEIFTVLLATFLDPPLYALITRQFRYFSVTSSYICTKPSWMLAFVVLHAFLILVYAGLLVSGRSDRYFRETYVLLFGCVLAVVALVSASAISIKSGLGTPASLWMIKDILVWFASLSAAFSPWIHHVYHVLQSIVPEGQENCVDSGLGLDTIGAIFGNPLSRLLFNEFCGIRHAEESAMFLTEVGKFQAKELTMTAAERFDCASRITQKYLMQTSPHEVNLPAGMPDMIAKRILAGNPANIRSSGVQPLSADVFDDAIANIKGLLTTNLMVPFLRSDFAMQATDLLDLHQKLVILAPSRQEAVMEALQAEKDADYHSFRMFMVGPTRGRASLFHASPRVLPYSTVARRSAGTSGGGGGQRSSGSRLEYPPGIYGGNIVTGNPGAVSSKKQSTGYRRGRGFQTHR